MSSAENAEFALFNWRASLVGFIPDREPPPLTDDAALVIAVMELTKAVRQLRTQE